MDRGAWLATVHGVAKSQTQLSNFTLTSGKNVIIVHSGYPWGLLLSPLLPSPHQSLCSHSVITCLVLEMLRHHRQSELGPLLPSIGHLSSCTLSSLSLVTAHAYHSCIMPCSWPPGFSRSCILIWTSLPPGCCFFHDSGVWRGELLLVLAAKESHSPSPLLWGGGYRWGLPFLWLSLEAVAQGSFALRFPRLI